MSYKLDYSKNPNLPTALKLVAAAKANDPFLWAKKDGEWKTTTFGEVYTKVRALAAALKSYGVEPGDRVCLVAENRPAWVIAHYAILSAGAVSVPAYTTNTVEDHVHILSDSGSKAVFVSSKSLAKRVVPAAQQVPGVETVIGIDDIFEAEGLNSVSFEAEAERFKDDNYCDTIVDSIDPHGLAVLIYTSGTGGKPKGVMLSHRAVLHNAEAAQDVLEEGYDLGEEIFLSFLPLSHSYEHMAGLIFPIATGAQIYYAESVDKLLTNMGEVRPTIMTAVPRLFESMRMRVLQNIQKASSVQKWMFWKAVEVGKKKILEPNKLTLLDRLLDPLLERLVRSKVRGRFGGRLKALVSGGAALTPDIGYFFQALGLELLQGYGQTETAPLISVNRRAVLKMDTVGPVVKGVEVKIAADGEILSRGDNNMMGYWNLPEATASTLVDGWIHTGDIGEFDEQGRLRITDRKKDIIVLSGGDNVSPARVEGLLTMQPEIGQAMVIGDKQPHLAGLLVPNEDFVKDWAAENGKPNDMAALAKDADFKKAIKAGVDRANKDMSNIEKVRKFELAREPFSTENAQMTPSLKTRRHVIKEVYADEFASMFH